MALPFVTEKSPVFHLLRSNQTVGVCHGLVQPAGEIYSLIPTRGRTQKSHGELEPRGAEACSHYLVFL